MVLVMVLSTFPRRVMHCCLPPLPTCGYMTVQDCTGLLHLTSLQKLTIKYCPKLENIVGKRLPAALIELNISACPLLKEQYRVKYPQTSHIPGIVVDEKWI
ncbi:unnamed protein product [Vicia faba]|uniref:Uncharacterized protein n=1 Tax=Vicia faba TaxID=3906 RepID=A0AAV0Z0M4_VICFA|nr:unnamed protein product [Vicia faba]